MAETMCMAHGAAGNYGRTWATTLDKARWRNAATAVLGAFELRPI